MFRGNGRPRPRNTRRRGRRNNLSRIPKTVTANAPFIVGRNIQIVSVPSHNDGLTIRRSVRFLDGLAGNETKTYTYADVFNKFFTELGIGVVSTSRISFSPEWVHFYASSDTTAANYIDCRIFDEPRTQSGTLFSNSPYFEANDGGSGSAMMSVKARVPKAATYTISSDDNTDMKLLPFINIYAFKTATAYVDVGGTWTIKKVLGLSDLTERFSRQIDVAQPADGESGHKRC